jgi:alginate O-acetyltransferase complex protein AlgI
VLLPVGISFITFQAISYAVDVYRGAAEPARNPLNFATFIALFPQLVAGPIIRYRTIASDLVSRRHTFERFASGVVLFWIGFSKKVLLANNFGLAADEVFEVRAAGMASAWLGLLAYTLQIYFDFSGYSDMAVGLGRMLGFDFPRNFDAPYRARSITEFWRRWHITLSTWIRDYLYISLGGNRGTAARTYRNLAVSMLLAGLWHGASWTFVAWGAFHAFWLIVERLNGRRPLHAALPGALQTALTLLLVMLAWVLFRSPSLSAATTYFVNLVDVTRPGLAADAYWLVQPAFWLLLAVGLAIVFRGADSMRLADERRPAVVVLQGALFLWSVAELLGQGFNPFLYFQF